MPNNVRKQKLVLILVEGKSDRLAFLPLEGFIKKTNEGFKESYKIHIEVVGEDLTTKKYKSNLNRLDMMCLNISQIVSKFLDDHKFILNDIAEIIHVVDMDGAYVPNECIKRMTESEKRSSDNELLYYEDSIHSLNYEEYPLGTHYRNIIKREALDYLVDRTKTITLSKNGARKKVSYSPFFMSCNLDHFLYNERNLDKKDKGKKAKAITIKYSGSKAKNYDELFERINDVPEMKDFIESWKYIRQRNKNSLKRCSNVLLINDLCRELTGSISKEK